MMMPIELNDTPTPLQKRDDSEIRERLLRKLGIFSLNEEPFHFKERSRTPIRSRKIMEAEVVRPSDMSKEFQGLLNHSSKHEVPLDVDPDLLHQDEKKVQFFAQATVINIPSYRNYSHKARRRLWTNLYDIQTNRERNAIEFAADNCEWRKATEEGSFIAVGGTLYHPETYRQLKAAQEHNLLVVKAELEERRAQRTRKEQEQKKKRRRHPARGNITKKKQLQRRNAKGGRVHVILASSLTTSLTRFADT